jgi:FkbM family methyltransferase
VSQLARHAARVRKLAAVLREPAYRRALRHRVAASIENESIPLRTDFRTVLDVGANRGQFAVVAARRFPDAELICFEPLAGPGARLRRAVGRDARLTLWPVALGASDEEAVFHVSAADDSSSLLVIGPGQREAFPGTQEQTTARVQVRRLDSLIEPARFDAPVLLKIDVQGGELAVLQGAERILESIHVVLVEVSFVELYKDQALADEVWQHLRGHGFLCRGIWSVGYGLGGECLQGDLLFTRRGFDPFGSDVDPSGFFAG